MTDPDDRDLIAELRGDPNDQPNLEGPWTSVRVPTLLAAARRLEALAAELATARALLERVRSSGPISEGIVREIGVLLAGSTEPEVSP